MVFRIFAPYYLDFFDRLFAFGQSPLAKFTLCPAFCKRHLSVLYKVAASLTSTTSCGILYLYLIFMPNCHRSGIAWGISPTNPVCRPCILSAFVAAIQGFFFWRHGCQHMARRMESQLSGSAFPSFSPFCLSKRRLPLEIQLHTERMRNHNE